MPIPVRVWLCCRPWWRELETDHQDHRGQSVLFQREDARSRGKGQRDNHRDQAGGETGQGEYDSHIWITHVWSVLLVKRTMENKRNSTFVICLQELILGKVREDMMVRTKISQSSALRQKRGHTAVSQRPESTETEAPVGLNNNSPYTQTEKNGLIHANGTTGEPGYGSDTMEELKSTSTDDNKEEESVSTDSLSEISKFESEFTFFIESLKDCPLCNCLTVICPLTRSHPTKIRLQRYIIFLCVLSSSQSRPELPA